MVEPRDGGDWAARAVSEPPNWEIAYNAWRSRGGGWRELADVEAGFEAGFRAAMTAMGVAVAEGFGPVEMERAISAFYFAEGEE